jgi:integrase
MSLPTGISIRPHRSGRQTIQIAFTYRGQHCRESLRYRPVTKQNLKYAADLVSRIRSEIASDRFDYLATFPQSKTARRLLGKGPTMTVSELLDEHLKLREKTLAPSTVAGLRSMVEERIKSGIGDERVIDLTPTRIAAWIQSPAMAGLSLKFIRNVMSPLRLALFHAVHLGYRPDNPVASSALNVKLLVPKSHWKSGHKPDPFTRSEIAKILDACEKPAFMNFVRFAFATGLRTGELIALRWHDVHVEERQIRVERAIVDGHEKATKTKKGSRWVDLDDDAIAALTDQKLITGHKSRVFWHPTTELPLTNASQVYWLWKGVITKAGVRFRCPKQTRHTYASTRITEGVNLFYLADQLGHEGIEMINRHYGAYIRENTPRYSATEKRTAESTGEPASLTE